MIKRVDGIGIPNPDECKHANLERAGDCAICSDCNAILPIDKEEKTAAFSEDTFTEEDLVPFYFSDT